MIKEHYKPFESFVLYLNYLMVAHGNIISYFDTVAKEWVNHTNFV